MQMKRDYQGLDGNDDADDNPEHDYNKLYTKAPCEMK